jgi:hypothetical protein
VNLAAAADLLRFGANVRFRHPLVRSAAYRAAAAADRRAVHEALAAATDPQADPDRRAWHHANAAAGPDEAVAQELIHSAGRAQRRGGAAAAAAFWERAVLLTPDPGERAARALTAAEAKYAAGDFEAAQTLLVTAELGPQGELGAARVQRMRAQIAFALRRGCDAPPLMLQAAQRLPERGVGSPPALRFPSLPSLPPPSSCRRRGWPSSCSAGGCIRPEGHTLALLGVLMDPKGTRSRLAVGAAGSATPRGEWGGAEHAPGASGAGRIMLGSGQDGAGRIMLGSGQDGAGRP